MTTFKINSKSIEAWILNSLKRLILNYQVEDKTSRIEAIEKSKVFLKTLYYILDEETTNIKSGKDIVEDKNVEGNKGE